VELLVRAWRGPRPAELAVENARIAAELAGSEAELELEPAEVLERYGGEAALGERFSQPFFGWDVPWGPDRLAGIAADSGAEAFDVWIVGGSVAASFFRDGSDTLAERLGADPGRAGLPVAVHGLARAAYKQPQQLNLVTFTLGLGGRPDLVINLDGFNELALGAQNAEDGVHPLYPASFVWEPLMVTDLADREVLDELLAMRLEQQRSQGLARLCSSWPFEHSAALAWLAHGEMGRIRARYQAARGRFLSLQAAGGSAEIVRGPPRAEGFEAALELSIRNWAECSRSLSSVCASRGIAYLHVLQPTFHDTGSKPATEAETETGTRLPELWIRAIQAGYERLRAQGAALRTEGVPFCDASQAFAGVTDALYIDGVHFLPEGSEILAARIAEACAAGLRR
jgi:hypothetical protein